jgi:hypothetical protein
VIRGLLLSLTLVTAGCAQDNPTIAPQGGGEPAESPTLEVYEDEDITVTATEYAFEGVPATVSAGPHNFTLENAGMEAHVFYLFLITGEESVEELVELPEEEANLVTQAVDRAEVGPGPGATDEFVADLTPGRFGYLCFVETDDGEPHFDLGMYGSFNSV